MKSAIGNLQSAMLVWYVVCHPTLWAGQRAYLGAGETGTDTWVAGAANGQRFGSAGAAWDALRGNPEIACDAPVLVARVTRLASGVLQISAMGAVDVIDWTEPAAQQLVARLAWPPREQAQLEEALVHG